MPGIRYGSFRRGKSRIARGEHKIVATIVITIVVVVAIVVVVVIVIAIDSPTPQREALE
ncbi:hypothetical protein [Desulfatirhabdium butyrativorans]|uniref:hypothetical protein n=1 Tax=Desulfatirhabdium butyrativorans TaxID=340467 RepID=UPI0012EC8863|nr:hypothetical protein [Desulfatirhabdium butyrativorans]